MDYMMNWKKKDYYSLRSAIKKFNNKIDRLSKQGYEFLPEKVKYQDLRSGIFTRKEFNRTIRSLNSFQKQSASDLFELESGAKITRWEKKILNARKKTAIRNLTSELITLENTLGTGNTRINEISSTLESLENWETKSKSELRRIKKRIKYLGSYDVEYNKASTFQKNFIETYKKFKRKEAVEIAKSFKNPIEFWEFIKETGLADLQLKYDVEEHRIKLNGSSDETYQHEMNEVMQRYQEYMRK